MGTSPNTAVNYDRDYGGGFYQGVMDVMGPEVERRQKLEDEWRKVRSASIYKMLEETPGLSDEEVDKYLNDVESMYPSDVRKVIKGYHDRVRQARAQMQQMSQQGQTEQDQSGQIQTVPDQQPASPVIPPIPSMEGQGTALSTGVGAKAAGSTTTNMNSPIPPPPGAVEATPMETTNQPETGVISPTRTMPYPPMPAAELYSKAGDLNRQAELRDQALIGSLKRIREQYPDMSPEQAINLATQKNLAFREPEVTGQYQRVDILDSSNPQGYRTVLFDPSRNSKTSGMFLEPDSLKPILNATEYTRPMRESGYQSVEIIDNNAPDGHRTALFDPSKTGGTSGKFLDPETMEVIEDAQRYYQPTTWAQQRGAYDPEIYAYYLGTGFMNAQNVPEAVRGDALQIAKDRGYMLMSDSAREEISKFRRVKPVIDSIDQLSTEINKQEGIIAKITGTAERVKARLNLNPTVAEYEALIQGFTPLIARANGHTGVLTEQDVISTRELFPKTTDSKEIRDRKIARIRYIMQGVDDITKEFRTQPIYQQVTPEQQQAMSQQYQDKIVSDLESIYGGTPMPGAVGGGTETKNPAEDLKKKYNIIY